MTKEQAIIYLKTQLENYLQSKGIDTRKNFKCLVCEGGHRTPNMGYDKKRDRIHCFACNADMDIIDLIGYETGKSGRDLFNYCYAQFNIYPDEPYKAKSEKPQKPPPTPNNIYAAYISECKARVNETDYFTRRGLSQKIIEKYDLGYDPAKKAVIIPYKGEKSYYITRSIETKEYYKLKGEQEPIFNLQAIYGENKYIFVTEGAIDALSVIEAGGEAIALNGTGYNRLINKLAEKGTKNTLILSLDNDESGREAQGKISYALKGLKTAFTEQNISEGYKDPNEALTANRELFLKAIREAENQAEQSSQQREEEKKAETEAEKRKYIGENSIGAYKMAFQSGIKENITEVPTGFPELDEVLDDGLYEGLYIVGAISSLGKTSFVLQIADQITKQGKDVLFFSLEMSKSELVAKSISRITYLDCGEVSQAKTARGITLGKRYTGYSEAERKLIEESTEKYFKFAEKNMYISEGIGDIGVYQVKEMVERHVKVTGNKPVLIIDYLQILSPVDIRASDKQNTDKAVFELKRLSRDIKMPIIGISSLNRENYNSAISMSAFKESGAIEYSSDVLLGLQFESAELNVENINRMKRQQPRKIELKILKNRSGATGDSITYDYYPMFNYFKETGKKATENSQPEDKKGAAKRR